MSLSVRHLPVLNVIIIADDQGQQFVLPRDEANTFMGLFKGCLADSIPDEIPAVDDDPGYSVRVPDVPALRLVGQYACDPDESCGQAS